MNNHINHVQLIGHLGQDPEIKEVGKGTTLVKVSLATNETYKDKNGEYQTKTQWHNLVAWGKLGENMANKAHKGNYIMVTGTLENNTWEAQDGTKRITTEVRLNNFLNFDRKKAAQAATI